jgi:hypothetical protein
LLVEGFEILQCLQAVGNPAKHVIYMLFHDFPEQWPMFWPKRLQANVRSLKRKRRN